MSQKKRDTENKEIFNLATERLLLIPLTLRHLYLCRTGRRNMEISLGLKAASSGEDLHDPTIREALECMISAVESDLENEKWLTNWEIIKKNENIIIGGMAFYGPPDKNGICEIAYVIQEAYRNSGYGSEAVKALIEWAFKNGAKSVKAEVSKNNIPSEKLLKNIGFNKFQESPDSYFYVIQNLSKFP